MPHLFIRTANSNDWPVLPLTNQALLLTGDSERPARLAGAADDTSAAARLVPVSASGSEWALLGDQRSARVNGEPLYLGIRALADKDEIQIAPGLRCFFSTETPPRVAPFPGADRAVMCPRCRLEIEVGQFYATCACGTSFHEILGERPCFTYGPCLACGRELTLDGVLLWTPEEV